MSRHIVEEVLGKRDAKELWGTGYRFSLPVTPQDYTLGSVLPAMLYMMRWGQRRGKGKFADVFGKHATLNDVSAKLATDEDKFVGFKGMTEQAILADLLLAFCLENKAHKLGRAEQVQRIFPTHYFSSWVDLPDDVANLRSVPEMLVAIVANQEEGAYLINNQGKGFYTIGSGFEQNLMLSLFSSGTSIEGQQDNVKSDKFDETTESGIDQLLAVRLAQALGEAPIKALGGKHHIPNQLPVSVKAAKTFFEDFNVFLRSFGETVPRQSLLPMIESCIAIGTTNIYLSTLKILLQWAKTGVVEKDEQSPWELFVDCSASMDMMLRRFSEEGVDDLLHRMAQIPIIMMCLRILDQRAEQERFRGLPDPSPNPIARICFLGDLLYERLDESRDIYRDLRRDCNKLAVALEEVGEIHAKNVLENEAIHPAWRMAEALSYLMGEKSQGKYRLFLDSSLMIDQPNGLARKRRTILKGKSTERRSIVLTNTAIDFLVHRHLRKSKSGTGPKDLSLNGFIKILRERYGFFIDEAPPGMSIPDDQLRKNRGYLERRLRDLGLFVGVNDAEAMKRLKQRFEVESDID